MPTDPTNPAGPASPLAGVAWMRLDGTPADPAKINPEQARVMLRLSATASASALIQAACHVEHRAEEAAQACEAHSAACTDSTCLFGPVLFGMATANDHTSTALRASARDIMTAAGMTPAEQVRIIEHAEGAAAKMAPPIDPGRAVRLAAHAIEAAASESTPPNGATRH